MRCIAYKDGYKFQLAQDYSVATGIVPDAPVDTDYFALTLDGTLTIKKAYAWDGPSGPAFDTHNFMRGSLVHDALYQMMREGYLSSERHREPADRLLQSLCKQDGMTALRAWWVYKGVKFFAEDAASPANGKPLLHSPKGCP